MSPEVFETLYKLLSKLTANCCNSRPTSPNYPGTDRTSLLSVKGTQGLEKSLGEKYTLIRQILVSAYKVSGSLLGMRDAAVNNTNLFASWSLYSSC